MNKIVKNCCDLSYNEIQMIIELFDKIWPSEDPETFDLGTALIDLNGEAF